MAQIPNNIGPAGAQGAAKPSGVSDSNLLGFLSLLRIDGKPLAQPETRKNPKELFDQIKGGLASHGFSETDLPKLAISILRDRKAGKVSFPELNSAYLKNIKNELTYSSLPPEMRARVTHGKVEAKSQNINPANTAATKFAEVKLHPEPPRIEQYKAPVEQAAPVLKLLNFFDQAGVLNA